MEDPLKPESSAEKSGNHDLKTGHFGAGNNAGTGGEAGWLKKVRKDLRALLPSATNTLLRVMGSEDEKAATTAAKVVLEFTVPKPRQTHRVEGKGGDPLAVLTAEQLVAFVKGEKP